jgi:uroporphyrinogen decarboxylase
MATMTGRERVLRAIDHREVDRVPIDLGGTPNSTMCAGAYASFARYLGLEARPDWLSRTLDTVRMEESVLARLPVDTRALYALPPARRPARWLDEYTLVDEWGITHRRPPGGRQLDPIIHPLAETTWAGLDAYAWPHVEDPARYAGLRARARDLHENTSYAICGSTADTVIFDRAWMLRGMEQFLADLLLDPGFATALLEKVADVQFRRHACFLAEVGPYLDVVMIADDMGVQRGPLIRPQLYRRLIKPIHRRYVELIRRYTGARIVVHACGSIADLVEDYIEIGVDALNPMQVRAAGMAPESLVARFGGRMAFWGGIDTQSVLPQGRPEEVRQAVRETLGVMGGCAGGYVLGAVHNIQDDVPPENVWAMLDEAAAGGGNGT